MEYKIHKKIRDYFNVHIYIRFFIGILLALLSLIPIILPFPWSFPIWVVMLIFWILLVVPAQKVRHVIKLRKGVVYMMKNIHRRRILKHKMNDISLHIKQILNEDKPRIFWNFHLRNKSKFKKKIIK